MEDTTTYTGEAAWARALRALALLAVAPESLGGIWLRARANPARDRLLASLPVLPRPIRKIPTTVADAQLFGDLDLSATLDHGIVVQHAGVLDYPAALVLTTAERCPPRLAAHLGTALEQGGHVVIALDEGAEAEERPPAALTDRLGLFVALEGLTLAASENMDALPSRQAIEDARARLRNVELPHATIAEANRMAAWLGIGSLRAPILTLAAARAAAALDGADRVEERHLAEAAALTLAHRGHPPPEAEAQEEPEDETPQDSTATNAPDQADEQDITPPSDLVLDAIAAALPPGLVDGLTAPRAAKGGQGSGAGAARRGNHRGRPLPARAGRPGGDARVDIVATLRTAAPWQTLRKSNSNDNRKLHVRSEDIRLRRFEETSDRVLIFAVDASGSLAMARLAEAKGAIELLLSEAYARRDHVALLAFRGTSAEVLLPPTRSLVQTKRRLQALPGGGGTPLAAGLKEALACAENAIRQGMTPTIVLLTDGRANIALDGSANRAAATEDATNIARIVRARSIPVLAIDTGARPQQALGDLADKLGAQYIALPRADSHRLSAAVSSALDG